MRDVREISVEIGAVAGRPAQYLGAFLRAGSTGPPASVRFADSVCRAQAPLRADRPGHAHSPALVDLVGRVPSAPPELPTGSQSRPCRGPGATCHLGRQGWRCGCRRNRNLVVPRVEVAVHPALIPREFPWRRSGADAEGCRRRGDGARRHLGRPVAPRLADWTGRPPGRRRAFLDGPGGSGTPGVPRYHVAAGRAGPARRRRTC